MRPFSFGALGVVLALAATPAAAELLPEATLRLSAARYAPSMSDFEWVGWIGGSVGLVRHRGVTGYVDAEVETTLGSARRAFDATQANYHLEPGLRRRFGTHDTELFFHHCSRHRIDREKAEAVDWNVLGARVSADLRSGFPTRLTLGIGHTTLASLIGYRWELTLRADSQPLRRPWGALYLGALGRLVTTARSDRFPRDGFVDWSVEAGVRLARGERRLETFVAWERRNDVLITEPLTKSRALVGFRLGLQGAPSSGP